MYKGHNTYTVLLAYLGGFLASWSFWEASGGVTSDAAFCRAGAAFWGVAVGAGGAGRALSLGTLDFSLEPWAPLLTLKLRHLSWRRGGICKNPNPNVMRKRGKHKKRCYLEVDVGTGSEKRGELGILENVLPLSGAVLFNAGYESVFFVLRPLLLLIPHSHSILSLFLCSLLLRFQFQILFLTRYSLPCIYTFY